MHPEVAPARPYKGAYRFVAEYLLLIVIVIAVITLPAQADMAQNWSSIRNETAQQVVDVGVYVVDLNNFNVADGTFGTNFYLTLSSGSPVSIDDFDIVNGHATSVNTLLDTPNEKSYRIFASMTADPDLHRYPFDRHTLPIEIEPKIKDESSMVLVVHRNSTGLEPEVDLPGWQLTGGKSVITSKLYDAEAIPYSRAIFSYDARRDTTSIVLKFFLPILLLLIVSLSSLMIKGPSRLAVNASMFIVAVFVHWRISDAIPLVAYATFLDLFMLITYFTMVMVLMSGILIIKFTESIEPERVRKVDYWSIRLIPTVSIFSFFLLFLTLAV